MAEIITAPRIVLTEEEMRTVEKALPIFRMAANESHCGSRVCRECPFYIFCEAEDAESVVASINEALI